VPARSHDQEIALGGGADQHIGGATLDDLALDLESLGVGRQLGDRVVDHVLGRTMQVAQAAAGETLERRAQIAVARSAWIAERPGVDDSQRGLPQARLCHCPAKRGARARGAVDSHDHHSARLCVRILVHGRSFRRVAHARRHIERLAVGAACGSSVAHAAGLTVGRAAIAGMSHPGAGYAATAPWPGAHAAVNIAFTAAGSAAPRSARPDNEPRHAMVDLTLTEQQESIREMAHDFAEKEIRPVAWEYDKDGTWPQDIINKAWELGLMNTHLPERYGGVDATYLDGCVIGEELAW